MYKRQIQVNDADGVVGVLIQHDIVDFGVVMSDAGGKNTSFLKIRCV